jgi:hypothetical protein
LAFRILTDACERRSKSAFFWQHVGWHRGLTAVAVCPCSQAAARVAERVWPAAKRGGGRNPLDRVGRSAGSLGIAAERTMKAVRPGHRCYRRHSVIHRMVERAAPRHRSVKPAAASGGGPKGQALQTNDGEQTIELAIGQRSRRRLRRLRRFAVRQAIRHLCAHRQIRQHSF